MRFISDLRKGDHVVAFGGVLAEVLCVVRTACRGGRAELVELPGGARLTPHHPVHVAGEWRLPADLAPVQDMCCHAVYTFILRGAPDFLVDGLPCVAMGHSLSVGAARHAYFGTDLVLRDLEQFVGFEHGFVELTSACVVRHPETGLVCRLVPMSV